MIPSVLWCCWLGGRKGIQPVVRYWGGYLSGVRCKLLRPTSGWDLLESLGHPCKFQRVSRLGSVTARHSTIGYQPYFVALNRGRHLYSTGRPSRWTLAHISSLHVVQLMPLPPHHLLLKCNPEWFTFLVPAYPACPGRKAGLLNGCSSSGSNSFNSQFKNELQWLV